MNWYGPVPDGCRVTSLPYSCTDFGDDQRAGMRDVVDEGAERIFQHHPHRVIVHRIGVIDHHIQALPLQVVLWIAGAIEARLHRRALNGVPSWNVTPLRRWKMNSLASSVAS